MGGVTDLIVVLMILGGLYILIKSGKLQELGNLKLPPLPGLQPPPAPIPPPPAAAAAPPSEEEDEPPPEAPPSMPLLPQQPLPVQPPAGGGGSAAATGTSIYKVVGPIAGKSEVTLRGGGTSNRDNVGFPCSKCARETTWIFKPGSGGDYSVKLGSHGSEGDPTTLIELGNIGTDSGGGKWQCEGPHMNYNDVNGGSGSGPAIGGKPRVGIKGISWPAGANAVHHEIWYDETGSGNNWKKIAEFTGQASGCNPITCPVPGASCQDTLRLDNVQGHQFIARSCVEIVPNARAGGPALAMRATTRRAYAYQASPTLTRSSPPPPTKPARTVEAGAVPLKIVDRDFQVPVRINNKPFQLTYDTGAHMTSISQAIATAAGITGKPLRMHGIVSGGGRSTVPVHSITMQIGNGPAFQTEVFIAAGSSVAGLLFMGDMFKSGYTPVLSDNPRLVKRGTAIVAPAQLTLGRELSDPTVQILINNKPLSIVYDTGGTKTYLNGADARAVGIDLSKPTRTITVTSAATNTTRQQPVFNVTMSIGGSAAFQTEVSVQEARPQSTLAGVDVLKAKQVAVLTQNNLRFVSPGSRVVAAVQAHRPSVIVAPAMTAPVQPGGYECFDQREDNILVHCCRHKANPPAEAHCKSTLEMNEYLKCCRDDKKAWANLW